MPTDSNQLIQQQLAEQLKGIALPEPVSWWPFAIGWWLVLAISLLLLTTITIKLFKQYKQNKYRKIAVLELQTLFNGWQEDANTTSYLHSTNALLKRVVREVEQNKQTQHLHKHGREWGSLLQRYSKQPLSDVTLDALTTACYKRKPDVDIPQLHKQITTWIKTHQRGAHA